MKEKTVITDMAALTSMLKSWKSVKSVITDMAALTSMLKSSKSVKFGAKIVEKRETSMLKSSKSVKFGDSVEDTESYDSDLSDDAGTKARKLLQETTPFQDDTVSKDSTKLTKCKSGPLKCPMYSSEASKKFHAGKALRVLKQNVKKRILMRATIRTQTDDSWITDFTTVENYPGENPIPVRQIIFTNKV